MGIFRERDKVDRFADEIMDDLKSDLLILPCWDGALVGSVHFFYGIPTYKCW